MIKKIFLDMDGVITDFEKMVVDNSDLQSVNHDVDDKILWPAITSIPNFWQNMPWMPGGKQLYSFVMSLGVPVEILSAPSRHDERSKPGKIAWLKKHGINIPANFTRASEKKAFAKPGYVLIDDLKSNIMGWKSRGGIGILHSNASSTISELKELQEEEESKKPLWKVWSKLRLGESTTVVAHDLKSSDLKSSVTTTNMQLDDITVLLMGAGLNVVSINPAKIENGNKKPAIFTIDDYKLVVDNSAHLPYYKKEGFIKRKYDLYKGTKLIKSFKSLFEIKDYFKGLK